MVGLIIQAIKHILDKTDTRIFHPDALEYIWDEEKLRKLEKDLDSYKKDVIFKYK